MIETIIATAVAAAMLGWNFHVIRSTGACCPPEKQGDASTPKCRSRKSGVHGELSSSRHRSRSSAMKKLINERRAMARAEALTTTSTGEEAPSGTANKAGSTSQPNDDTDVSAAPGA